MTHATKVRNRWLAGAAAVGLFGLAGTASAGTIIGSAHDFSTTGWSGGQICVACHTPHNANITVADAPLWNHTLTTKVYQLYTSPTLQSTPGQPSGASKLCLSCHDGTVALDSFGGATGTTFINAQYAIGSTASNDLQNDHPISITYNTALATADGGLHDPATRTVTVGSGTQTRNGTIDAVMLYSGQIQCASCHDVHNTFTVAGINGDPLLKVSKAGSAICLTCHNK